MTGKIAITPRSLSGSGHPALSALTEKGYELVFPNPGKMPSEADLLKSIPGCVAWLAGVEPISARVLQSSSDLRVISRNGAGIDNIDINVAADQGISIQRAVGANARGVAELAITLMLSTFRHVPWSDGHLSEGRWQRRIGVEVDGRTLGVVGCGAIGRIVAELAIGLGMNVVGYDPFPSHSFDPPGFHFASLGEVLESADAITLHCPPADEPIINASAIAKMKRGVVIINTARAELIESDAVLNALNEGHISSLATDVYYQEPPIPSPLLSHESVILTPHAGGFTEESVERATSSAVGNILKILES